MLGVWGWVEVGGGRVVVVFCCLIEGQSGGGFAAGRRCGVSRGLGPGGPGLATEAVGAG
jgi:hypothetical protein